MNTILATGPTPTKSYGGARLHRIRTAKGYEFVVRVLGSGWFLTLALVATQRTYGYATAMKLATSVRPPGPRSLRACVWSSFIWRSGG